jgi:mannose-6-phosphate isomerase-like protein (cupin superfamily)
MTDALAESEPEENAQFEKAFDETVEQARKVQTFRYDRPDIDAPKAIMKLAQTDLVKGAVQIIGPDGRNNLHSHAGADTFWMVLKGRARFYGGVDEVINEFGPYEGIVTPRGTPYWFESADPDVDLELLQVAGFEKGVKDIRTNHEPRSTVKRKKTERYNGRTN